MTLPLISSDQLCTALRRAGFEPALRSTRGSHQTWSRGDTIVVVVLGRREIPRGTLKSVLRQAGWTEETLRRYL